MALPVNPDTYRVFLQILEKAPCATTYHCKTPKEGGPKATTVLPGKMFDQLPWKGEVGDIISATWEFPREYASLCSLPLNQVTNRITASLTDDGGVLVRNYLDRPWTNAVGLVGVMPGNPLGMDFSNPHALNHITVSTSEEMVAQALDLITAGNWLKADERLALQRGFSK